MNNQYLLLLWLLLLGTWASPRAWAQAATRRISGTVRSADQREGLPGVTVLQAGTTNGASTDVNGKFELSVPATGNHTLRFSYVGYMSQDVAIGTKSTFDVQLTADSKQLDDVVVGYQEARRRDGLRIVGERAAAQGHSRELGC